MVSIHAFASSDSDAAPTDPTGEAPPTAITLEPGELIGGYAVEAMIASGGTSVVYRARDTLLGRIVALKQILIHDHPEPQAVVQRARTEGLIQKKAAQDDPRHLVGLIDIIDDARGLILVTEYIDGPTLEAVLARDSGPMDPHRAMGYIAAAAKALENLHAKQILHRDLKPANLLLPAGGGLKVADFGLATILQDQDTLTTGSPRYMAPELLRNQTVDARADLYPLGMIAYEMLAGRARFDQAFKSILRDTRNRDMRWMKWHTNPRTKAPALRTLVPDLPQPIEELVDRLLEKEPSARIASATELLGALRRIFTPPTPGTTPGSFPENFSSRDTTEHAPGSPAPPGHAKISLKNITVAQRKKSGGGLTAHVGRAEETSGGGGGGADRAASQAGSPAGLDPVRVAGRNDPRRDRHLG